MRKTQKIVASILCSILLITSAIPANAASPYAVVIPCTQCRVGSVSRTTNRVYMHNVITKCEHTGIGSDVCEAYKVTVNESCNNCSYGYTDVYMDYVLVNCYGGSKRGRIKAWTSSM